MVHVNIRVSGKVQGVNYRYSAKGKALELQLTGFVRNEPDGTVYLEAEGAVEQVEKLKGWCKLGPPRAQVTQIVTHESEIRGFEGFEILR